MNVRGFTLVELLVVLVLLGITYGAVGVAIVGESDDSGVPDRIRAARVQAVRTGRPVSVTFRPDVQVTLHPDGSATPLRVWDGERVWEVDVWSGGVRRAP